MSQFQQPQPFAFRQSGTPASQPVAQPGQVYQGAPPAQFQGGQAAMNAPIGGSIPNAGVWGALGGVKAGMKTGQYMRRGTYWCVVRAVKGDQTNRQKQQNFVVEMEVIHVVDAAVGIQKLGEAPHRIGESVTWLASMKQADSFLQKVSGFVLVATGVNLEGKTEQECVALMNQIGGSALEFTVLEVVSRPHITQRGLDITVQDFKRRVPWQEVQMVLNRDEDRRFFHGTLPKLAAAEASYPENTLQGWSASVEGPGAVRSEQAVLAANYRPITVQQQPAPYAPAQGAWSPPAQPAAAPAPSPVQQPAPYTPPQGAQPPAWQPPFHR